MQACGSALLLPGFPCMLSRLGPGNGEVGRWGGRTEARGGAGQARGKGNGSLVLKQQKPIAEEPCLPSKGGGQTSPF